MRPLPCLQCDNPYHPEAVCPTTFQNIPSAAELLHHDAGASVYSEGDVTRSTSSTGFITIRRETRPHDPDQIMEECAYCQGPPHSPTECPTIINAAGPLASREPKPTRTLAKPRKRSNMDAYPNRPIKPLPKRVREPRP